MQSPYQTPRAIALGGLVLVIANEVKHRHARHEPLAVEYSRWQTLFDSEDCPIRPQQFQMGSTGFGLPKSCLAHQMAIGPAWMRVKEHPQS